MKKYGRIAVGGSAADPPHIGHFRVLEAVRNSGLFDLVIWILSGTSEAKPDLTSAQFRTTMTNLMIPKNWFIGEGPCDFFVIYQDAGDENTPSIDVIENLEIQYPDAKITWFTGSDSVEMQDGMTKIERKWTRGWELHESKNFLIIPRAGFPQPWPLPGNYKYLDVDIPDIQSSVIREKIATGDESWKELVTPEVVLFIQKFLLYDYKESIDE